MTNKCLPNVMTKVLSSNNISKDNFSGNFCFIYGHDYFQYLNFVLPIQLLILVLRADRLAKNYFFEIYFYFLVI